MSNLVFGPVPSRRLGRSLGLDLVPFKTCTYDCIYCQLGRTTEKTVERKPWVPIDNALDQLRQKLATRPDYVTLSGSGEPTLHAQIGEVIDRVKTITDVLTDSSEHATTVPMVEQIEKDFGKRPSKLLADGAHATGQNIVALEERGVDFYSPVQTHQPQDGNPAKREDVTQAVPESEWSKLPRNPRGKKLDRSAFVYVPEKDEYYCPLGTSLPYEKTKYPDRLDGRVKSRVYRCQDHEGCPLAKDCLENVKTEWLWTCTAFNLKKLTREVVRLRAHFRNLQETVGV